MCPIDSEQILGFVILGGERGDESACAVEGSCSSADYYALHSFSDPDDPLVRRSSGDVNVSFLVLHQIAF
jgi:hypothetical protein